MRRVVSGTVAKFVYPRVAPRSFGVTLRKLREEFGYKGLVEEEARGTAECGQITLLAQSYDLHAISPNAQMRMSDPQHLLRESGRILRLGEGGLDLLVLKE